MKKKMISIIIFATVLLLGRGFVANNLSTEGNFLRFQTSEFSFGYTSGVCTHEKVKAVYKAIGGQAGASQHNVYEKCTATNCNYEKFLNTENHSLGTIKNYSSDEAKTKFGANYSAESHYYTKCSKECGQGFSQGHNWELILIPENEVAGYGWPTDVYHYCWSVCAQCKEQKKNDTGVYIATPVMHVFDMGKCFSCPKPQPGYGAIENTFVGSELIRFTYKGVNITIDSATLKIIMNMLSHEPGNTIEQRIAVFQVLLNQYIEGNKSIYDIINSGRFSTEYAPGSGNEMLDKSGALGNYPDQVKDAVMSVVSNSNVSNNVAGIIGDSTIYAGDNDSDNYKNALLSYDSTLVIDDSSILYTDTGSQHTIFTDFYPDRCTCGGYISKGNICAYHGQCCGNANCRFVSNETNDYTIPPLNEDGTCPTSYKHT